MKIKNKHSGDIVKGVTEASFWTTNSIPCWIKPGAYYFPQHGWSLIVSDDDEDVHIKIGLTD